MLNDGKSLNDFPGVFHGKNRVAAFDRPALESHTLKEVTEAGKTDVGIGAT